MKVFLSHKESKHPGKLVLELPEPGTASVFLLKRLALLIETANVVKYRTEIIIHFSVRGRQLEKINTSICSVPRFTTMFRRFKKMYEWHKTSFSMKQFLRLCFCP